ncbi:hypothetical protein Leryth_002616 [Lithospermum erythrorhizon]|uniref:AT-hook motif nuclear-localized protein n=1 Tax=Lithospermum erythrorhizon TaxID=34254 RepID=A0AAV3QXS7_LITER|nr:hypothetical protein Leryth_002616 [Lithospermum erythrorhizon]
MANRWWTGQVGLQGVETSSTSAGPVMKTDLAISMNDEDEDINNNNNYEPKEGAIELSNRRPRGRPAGSKNKPKPPIFVTRDSPNALRSHVMEVADGSDIADSIAQFARRRQRGVCVMSASGIVINVTLSQPSAGVMALHGRFEILSLTGSFLPGPAPPGSSGLTIYLAGGQGQVVGGSVVGCLIAAGPVMVIASTFCNATYERLPLEEDEEPARGGGGGSPPGLGLASGGGGGNMSDPSSVGLLPVYNNLVPNCGGQLNPDAFASWAQARPPY